MLAFRVDQQADVFGGVAANAGPAVVRALQPARQQLNAGQALQRQADLDRVFAHSISLVSDPQGVEERAKVGWALMFGNTLDRQPKHRGSGWPRAEPQFRSRR